MQICTGDKEFGIDLTGSIVFVTQILCTRYKGAGFKLVGWYCLYVDFEALEIIWQ